MRTERLGILAGIRREQVVADDVFGASEPERRQLRKDPALVRHGGAEYHVVGGDPVGGDHEEVLADLVHVADLAATVHGDAVKRGLEQ